MMDEKGKQKATLQLLDMVHPEKLKNAISLAFDIIGPDEQKKQQAMQMLLLDMIPEEKLHMAISLALIVGGQDSVSMATANAASEQSCDYWRLRGNQSYKSRKLDQAEDYYTRGLNCISPDHENYKSCSGALVLCYNNRAVVRMSLGRVKEALDDCMMAASIDPSFLKVKIQAAECYLALGETDNAMNKFSNCLQSSEDLVVLDEKKSIMEGLEQAKRASDCLYRADQLLQRWSHVDDVSKALEFINEGLAISPFSEKFIELKVDVLFRFRKYYEVIQLCEGTLESARKNHGDSENIRFWRWEMISMAYFLLGKLEEAHGLLQKIDKKDQSIVTAQKWVSDMLSLKAEGNEAFQAGRHLEAVKHYSAALASNRYCSWPFAAICLCYRAAACQSLGQITDAIADCSLAIALDSSYTKAISRRAILHEMIRDYKHAVTDLQRLVSLLEDEANDRSNQNGKLANNINATSDLKQACSRLARMQQEVRKGSSLNMYMILRIDPKATTAEIKKAFREAALRHHPDKVDQFLIRNKICNDQFWGEEISDEFMKDADTLFKMIGEAFTVLSDPVQRLRYNAKEGIRTARN